MSTRSSNAFDIAVIGGGLVGASLACALAPMGLKTAVLEAVPPRASAQPSYDDRTLALGASACNILKGLGIWPHVRDSATAIREVWVAELNRPGRVRLKAAELNLEAFGHVVEARVFGAAVTRMLPELSDVKMFCPARVTGIEAGEDVTQVTCMIDEETVELSAKLVVGADGAESTVRQALGIESQRHDYGTAAVICNFTPGQAHAGRAFECFTPSGPLAVLPHVEGRCGLVRCLPREELEEALAQDGAAFIHRAEAEFNNAMGPVLGPFSRIGTRSSYPLKLVRATEDLRPRAVIMGNAAHAIHPIGAQGFNLGLRDVAVLAEVLAGAVDRGEDIGGLEVLLRYSDWRAADQDGTVGWSDGLARLYANRTRLAAGLRTAGMLAHALIPAVRRRTAIRAMGFRGRIPRLAQGLKLMPGGSAGMQT